MCHMPPRNRHRYEGHIFFAELAGKRNVVCFRDMASCVINDKWYSDKRTEIVDESLRVVIAAAKLIKAQIREIMFDMDKYPVNAQFDDVVSGRKWVPELLQTFMENIVCDDLKQVALSHCIIQASRPRSVISPITFGLGISLDKAIGSHWLLNTLARLGMSISYDEATRYKQSAMQSDIDDLPPKFPLCFTQFAGDNIDHNVCTLDGRESFHGMGIISISTPCMTDSNGTVTADTAATADSDSNEPVSDDIVMDEIVAYMPESFCVVASNSDSDTVMTGSEMESVVTDIVEVDGSQLKGINVNDSGVVDVSDAHDEGKGNVDLPIDHGAVDSKSVGIKVVGEFALQQTAITRLKRVTVDKLVRNHGIPILPYSAPESAALATFLLKPLQNVQRLLPSCAVSVPVVIDLIWDAGYYFQEDLGTRPNWAGFMQDVCVSTNRHPVSDIRMLPIIDLNPNDMSCIFSTLTFLEKQAKLLSMETACVTFDQPLYIKAVEIVKSSKMDVVCRLGGFHLLINFLGAIGTIMAGSGLVEALQTCYGPVALSHMMTGKAYAKAVRAHILVESALTVLLLNHLLADESDDSDTNQVIQVQTANMCQLKQLYSDAINHCLLSTNDIVPCIQRLHDKLTAYQQNLSNENRTARLWLQYMRYINIVKLV